MFMTLTSNFWGNQYKVPFREKQMKNAKKMLHAQSDEQLAQHSSLIVNEDHAIPSSELQIH